MTNKKIKSLDDDKLDELCKYVCNQTVIAQSDEIDRETLYFAIYWKICDFFETGVFLPEVTDSKISAYREGIQQLIQKCDVDSFNCLSIVDRNIDFCISKKSLSDLRMNLFDKKLFKSNSFQLANSIS